MSKNERGKPKKKLIELPTKSKVKALIFYSNNFNPKECNITDLSEEYFLHNNRAYYIDFSNVMFFKNKTLFNLIFGGNTYYLFYYYKNDKPLKIDESLSCISQKRIDNSIIATALKSKAIQNANDIKKGFDLGDNIIYIIIGGAILFFIFYMFGGA